MGLPLSAHLDVTHQCDLRCAHCYLEERGEDALDSCAWRRVIDDLAALQVFELVFGGGEMLLRGDALELLTHARRQRFAIVVKSHGGSIDAPLARELRRLAVRYVDVSLYALDAAVHERVTRRPGSHARTLRGIEHLAAAGVPVGIACPAMAENVDALPALAAWCSARGFAFLASPGLFPGNRGADLPGDQGLAGAALASWAALEASTGVSWPTVAPSPEAPVCGAGDVTLYVGPAGEVRPCSMWPEVAGNVLETPLSRLWREAPVLLRARTLTQADRRCGDCADRAACPACPARSLLEAGDPRAPARFDCDLAAARRRHRTPGSA